MSVSFLLRFGRIRTRHPVRWRWATQGIRAKLSIIYVPPFNIMLHPSPYDVIPSPTVTPMQKIFGPQDDRSSIFGGGFDRFPVHGIILSARVCSGLRRLHKVYLDHPFQKPIQIDSFQRVFGLLPIRLVEKIENGIPVASHLQEHKRLWFHSTKKCEQHTPRPKQLRSAWQTTSLHRCISLRTFFPLVIS